MMQMTFSVVSREGRDDTCYKVGEKKKKKEKEKVRQAPWTPRLSFRRGEVLRGAWLTKTLHLGAGQGAGGWKHLTPAPRRVPPVLFTSWAATSRY